MARLAAPSSITNALQPVLQRLTSIDGTSNEGAVALQQLQQQRVVVGISRAGTHAPMVGATWNTSGVLVSFTTISVVDGVQMHPAPTRSPWNLWGLAAFPDVAGTSQ